MAPDIAPRLHRSRGLRGATTLTLGILTISLAHALVGTATHPQHVIHVLLRAAYLFPIVVAAIWYGRKGGLLAAGGVAVLTLLHASLAWRGAAMENTNQAAMVLVYLVLGSACGELVDRRRYRERALTCQALLGLAEALEVRDGYTRAHSEAVAALSVRLGRRLALSPRQLEDLRLAALVHDIGKIGIPDDVLLKPGKLTPDERVVIERHPLLAAQILGVLEGVDGVIELVLLHHEYPDGSGYPRGLVGEDVPLSARILQVADVYSALTDERPYKPPLEPEVAMEILQEMAGEKLDAPVVAALEEVLAEPSRPLSLP